MTFEELRPEIQEIAAQTLFKMLTNGYCSNKEEAIETAANVKAAFVKVFTEEEYAARDKSAKTCAFRTQDPAQFNFVINTITPLPCNGDGVSRVYHDTMIKCLKIEIEKLRSRIAVAEIVAN
ncbi:MAG TPA: hypothetical protein VGI71_16060 [Scandinavium sp.]|jgi:hypothetical protein